MSPPLDLDVISREWLRVCGPHDYGMPVADCACPDGDPRSVISRLVAEIERLRAERDDACERGRDDEADDEPAVPSVRRRVPTQAERIAAAIADGHHRITTTTTTATTTTEETPS